MVGSMFHRTGRSLTRLGSHIVPLIDVFEQGGKVPCQPSGYRLAGPMGLVGLPGLDHA